MGKGVDAQRCHPAGLTDSEIVGAVEPGADVEQIGTEVAAEDRTTLAGGDRLEQAGDRGPTHNRTGPQIGRGCVVDGLGEVGDALDGVGEQRPAAGSEATAPAAVLMKFVILGESGSSARVTPVSSSTGSAPSMISAA